MASTNREDMGKIINFNFAKTLIKFMKRFTQDTLVDQIVIKN